MHKYSYVDTIYNREEKKSQIVASRWLGNTGEKIWDRFDIDNRYKYFYVLKDEAEIHRKRLKINISEKDYITVDGRICKRITPELNLNKDELEKLKRRFKNTYESDVGILMRWICEEKPVYTDRVRKIYNDIETLRDTDTGDYSNVELATGQICINGFYDDWTGVYTIFGLKKDFKRRLKWLDKGDKVVYINCKSEKELLVLSNRYVGKYKPDYLLGWFNGSYDMPYSINRMKNLKVDFQNLSPLHSVYIMKNDRQSTYQKEPYKIKIAGVGIFDLLSAYIKLQLPKECNRGLDAMSKHYLGKKIGKDRIGDISEAYQNRFEDLVEYNIRDLYLTKHLDKKIGIFKSYQTVQHLASLNVEQAMVQGTKINYDIKQNSDYVLMDSTLKVREGSDLRGGYVYNSKPGVKENCIKNDLKSAYPSFIISANISPDTQISTEQLPYMLKHAKGFKENLINIDGKFYFDGRKTGSVAGLVKERYELRIKYKAEKKIELATMYKVQLNSVYGQFTSLHSRIFNYDCGKAITYIGRTLINEIIEEVEKRYAGEVVLADTDSIVFHSTRKNFRKENITEVAQGVFNRFYKRCNIRKNKVITLEFEKMIDKMIVFVNAKDKDKGVKKKYIEWTKKDNKIRYVGMDLIKSDTQEIARDMQKDYVKLFLKYTGKVDKEMLDGMLDRYKERFAEAVKDKNYYYIAIPAKISKSLKHYKGETFNVRAIQNAEIEIMQGDEFWVITTDEGPMAFRTIKDLELKNERYIEQDREELKIDEYYLWDRAEKKADMFYHLIGERLKHQTKEKFNKKKYLALVQSELFPDHEF